MKLFFVPAIVLCIGLSADAQSEEVKVNYNDSIVKVDSLIAKRQGGKKYIEEARKFALAPELKLQQQIHEEKALDLQKLDKKLKRGKISQEAYNKKKAKIDWTLFKVDSIIGLRTKGFDKMLLNSEKTIDSLEARKAYFNSKL